MTGLVLTYEVMKRSRNVWENESQMIILWLVDYMFVAVQYLIIISQVVLTIVKMDLLPISILPISIKIEEKLNSTYKTYPEDLKIELLAKS